MGSKRQPTSPCTDRLSKMRRYNRVTTAVGHFDLAHPNEKQVQIIFHWRPDAPEEVRQRTYVLAWSPDDPYYPDRFESAWEAIEYLKEYSDGMIWNLSKWINAAYIYLDSMRLQDEYDRLQEEMERCENRMKRIRDELVRIKQKLQEVA